jgi:ABC-2 type transport system ATP-binding protein
MDASEPAVVLAEWLTKRFDQAPALDDVSLRIGRGRVVGLVGRNGSGKTTLLRTILGLDLPTSGAVRVFGTPTPKLGAAELERIGAVFQESRFLPWMTGAKHLAFVRSFQKCWDDERERRLLDALELDPAWAIGAMSPGNVQKLAIVSAVCHHPELLLLDEPAAALDPIAREALLQAVLEIVGEDAPTIVVSSHALRDVERIADWIVCLERGRVVEDAPLDEIQERHGQWIVTARGRELPPRFHEPWVVSQRVDSRRAELLVRDPAESATAFAIRYGAEVETRGLELERMFPLWIGAGRS